MQADGHGFGLPADYGEPAVAMGCMPVGRSARSVIVPLALGALLTGLLVPLGTKWGPLRQWWVVVSLALTTFAIVVLLVETGTIAAYAAVAADPTASNAELRSLRSTPVHSVGGALVLLVALVLNIYKAPGLTPYGWRKQREERRTLHRTGLGEASTVRDR